MSQSVLIKDTPDALRLEGLTETVEPWEDGLRADTGPGTFEWWYFDAHFDDGSTAVIVFATKPILERDGPLKPNVSLTITRPDGSKTAQFPLYPPEEFSAATDHCDVRIGSNHAQGDLHRYQVQVELDGLGADLVFEGRVPPWRPGAGKLYFGDQGQYFAWLPSIPHGNVSGTLTYDGQTRSVQGTGYHDHNWGNVGLHQVMDHWYWGRAHIDGYTLIFVEQIAAKKYGNAKIPVFMLANSQEIIADQGSLLTMQAGKFVRHPQGQRYPLEVDFNWRSDSGSVHISLRKPGIIEAVSLLLIFPFWKRAIARLFANPYYFRFNTTMELSIDLPGHQLRTSGPALYEIMLFK